MLFCHFVVDRYGYWQTAAWRLFKTLFSFCVLQDKITAYRFGFFTFFWGDEVNPWSSVVRDKRVRSGQAYVAPVTSTSQRSQASSMSAVLERVSCDGEYYLCGQTEAKEGGWVTAFQHQGSFYYCYDSCNTQTRGEGLLKTFQHNPAQPLWSTAK